MVPLKKTISSMKYASMIDAVVFDFDGVIVDSEPLHWRSFQQVLSPLGFSFSWEEYLERYVGLDDRGAFRAAFRATGRSLDEARLGELITLKAAAFQQEVAGGVAPYPGVLNLIREAASHFPIALCSGALRSDIHPVLQGLGLQEVFPVIVSAEEVRVSKPDPESYTLAFRRLENLLQASLSPSRCMAIEDTPAGIASARAAGFCVLAVTNNFPPQKLGEANHIVSTLEGVDVRYLMSTVLEASK